MYLKEAAGGRFSKFWDISKFLCGNFAHKGMPGGRSLLSITNLVLLVKFYNSEAAAELIQNF